MWDTPRGDGRRLKSRRADRRRPAAEKIWNSREPICPRPGLIDAVMVELSNLHDADVLARFHRGEVAALGELARRYECALLGLASGLLDGRRDLARDCVQDCWLRVIKYGKGFDGRASLKTWLYRMVINRSRDLRERHRVVSLSGSAGHGNGPAAGELQASWSAGESVPTGTSGRNEAIDVEALGRAVGRLAEGTRLIVLLCYHRGMTHEVAAEILAIPVGTLKSRLHAGLNELRNALSAGASERT